MSSNIYEQPDFNMKVRYSKGVTTEERGQRKERVVDIYECANNFKGHRVDALPQRVDVSTRGGGGANTQRHPPAAQRNYKAFALILGLLCVLLIFGVTALATLYFTIVSEKEKLSDNYKELEERFHNLNDDECQSQGTGWRRFQCSCYYISSEMKNWTESRKDCQSRGADLVTIQNREENDFVKELSKHGQSWIGLQSVKEKENHWDWKWVDKKTRPYRPWKVGVKVLPQEGGKVYIDQGGTWMYNKTGSMQWICEKFIYESLM